MFLPGKTSINCTKCASHWSPPTSTCHNHVANMHELLTVLTLIYSENLNSIISLAVGVSISISTACMPATATWTSNLLVLLCRPHPSIQVNSSCSNTLQWRHSRSVESTTRLWQRTDLVSRFARGSVACWAGLSKRAALCAVRSRMHLYGYPCLCTRHCNSDQSWAFWTCRRAHLSCPPG